jgi:DNA-binding response OmpR family regulator
MKKILLIDDDIDILNVVKLLLSYNHYKVKAISKWQIITETIKEFTPDLILLDIDLGGADGSEICRNLKRSEGIKDVPIILISAHNMPVNYLKRCKAEAFIAKPFEVPDLLETIKNNLN